MFIWEKVVLVFLATVPQPGDRQKGQNHSLNTKTNTPVRSCMLIGAKMIPFRVNPITT